MKMNNHRFPYCWKKEDLDKVQKNGLKVFSTFSCGGGSSFGYKMAGYDVVGCNDIDKEMMGYYLANHHPKYSFLEPIQEFKNRKDIPEELYNIDILDGSPPCSTFSVQGSREKVWGKNKKFREGQSEQKLSDLFFEYLDLVNVLKPKVAVAENVGGMLIGKAKGYCKLIFERFEEIGYDPQLFLLNGATMGLPQARSRVFFVARRKDLGLPSLKMNFKEEPVTIGDAFKNLPFQDLEGTEPAPLDYVYWPKTKQGGNYSDVTGGGLFAHFKLSETRVGNTITAAGVLLHPTEMRKISWIELCLMGSYPFDYDFLGRSRCQKIYCIGMSVPPVMMAHVSAQIAEQCFNIPAEQIGKGWGK